MRHESHAEIRRSTPPLNAYDLQAAFDLAFRIENPLLKSPASVDCVSCHVADRARTSSLDQLGTSANQYTHEAFDLSLSQKHGVRVQRSFGYIGRLPAVNQRVVNESAEVALTLSHLP